jgi:hypothetical protein
MNMGWIVVETTRHHDQLFLGNVLWETGVGQIKKLKK